MQLLCGRTEAIDKMAISHDGRYVMASSRDGRFLMASPHSCHVWDLHDPKFKPRVIPSGNRGYWDHDVQFLSATHLFVRTVRPNAWYRHDLETGVVTTNLMRRPAMPWDKACVNPSDGLVKVLSRRKGTGFKEAVSYQVSNEGQLLPISVGTPGPLLSSLHGFSPSGTHYLAGAYLTQNPSIKYHVFETATDATVTTFERPRGCYSFDAGEWCFSTDGRQLYVAVNWWLMCYDCATGGLPTASLKLQKHKTSSKTPIAAHPDGRLLATVEDGRVVTFRDADTLEVLRRYDFAMPTVTCVAFTPDGTRCVIGNTKGKVLLFDVD